MGLKAVVESLDAIPEAQRGAYAKGDDGKFHLDIDGVDEHPAVQGLKTSQSRAITESKTLKKKLEAFGDADPERVAKALKALEEAEASGTDAEKAKARVDVDKLRQKLEAEAATKVTAAEQRATTAETKIRNMVIDTRVRSAALKAGVLADDLDDVVTLTRARFDLDDTEKVVVLDADGEPSMMSVEKFFAEEFKKAKPKFYAGSGASGSGADRSAALRNTGDQPLSATQKIAAGLEARGR